MIIINLHKFKFIKYLFRYFVKFRSSILVKRLEMDICQTVCYLIKKQK